MFRFQSPYYFILLIPLAILVVLLEFRRRPASVVFSDVSLLRTLPRTFTQQIGVFVPWMLYVGILLLIVSLARPQSGKAQRLPLATEGIALAMCVDRSGSMAAMDFMSGGRHVSRLDAVKQTFRDFVAGNDRLPGRPDDQIGLLAFGGYVDAFCPLTLDHDTLLQMLDQVNLIEPVYDNRGNIVERRFYEEENMTAIGDALVMAVGQLKETKAKSKVIVLLSDGEQNAGTATPEEGAEAAKANGIKIHTIGIGSTGPAPFVSTDPFGNRRLMQQYMVMDEDALRNIAAATGGKYFNAKNTRALEEIYAEIDKLEKTALEGRVYTQYTELYRGPLLAGLLLVFLHLALVSTRFRRLP